MSNQQSIQHKRFFNLFLFRMALIGVFLLFLGCDEGTRVDNGNLFDGGNSIDSNSEVDTGSDTQSDSASESDSASDSESESDTGGVCVAECEPCTAGGCCAGMDCVTQIEGGASVCLPTLPMNTGRLLDDGTCMVTPKTQCFDLGDWCQESSGTTYSCFCESSWHESSSRPN